MAEIIILGINSRRDEINKSNKEKEIKYVRIVANSRVAI